MTTNPLPPDLPGDDAAAKLRALLEQSDLPLVRIARELGTSDETLRRVLTGHGADPARPFPSWLRRLRKVQVTDHGTLILLWPARRAEAQP